MTPSSWRCAAQTQRAAYDTSNQERAHIESDRRAYRPTSGSRQPSGKETLKVTANKPAPSDASPRMGVDCQQHGMSWEATAGRISRALRLHAAQTPNKILSGPCAIEAAAYLCCIGRS